MEEAKKKQNKKNKTKLKTKTNENANCKWSILFRQLQQRAIETYHMFEMVWNN